MHVCRYICVCMYIHACECVCACTILWLIQFFSVTTILIMLPPRTEQLHVNGGRIEEARLSIVGEGNYKIQGQEGRMIYVV